MPPQEYRSPVTPYFVCFLIGLVCGFLLAFPIKGNAQENKWHGRLGVCDTAEQAEQVIVMLEKSDRVTVLGCTELHVVFERHETVKVLSLRGNPKAITRIEVLAYEDDGEMEWLDEPLEQFTILQAETI